MSDIKEVKDELGKLVTDFQEEHKKLAERGQETSEGLEEIKNNFAELSEEFQNSQQALKAEQKAREDLELTLARAGSGGKEGEIKSNPEYVKGFYDFLQSKKEIESDVIDAELKNLVEKSCGKELTANEFVHVKTMLVGSNPDGGYLVPVDMLSRISTRIFESSPMRDIATVISTANEAVELVIDDQEFDSGWVAELDDRPETDSSKIGTITIPTHEQYAMPIATQKLLDDATVNIESWISGKISQKFARTENTAFVAGEGDSVKKPTGILFYDDWGTLGTYERGKLETRETATASTLAADDLIDLQTDLFEFYQANATWVMRRKTWAEVMKLKDNNDNYLLNPAMMFQGALGLQLLGKPVRLFADMEGLADGDIPIAYGDFREGYTIVDRIGIRVLRDPLTTKGKVKFYTTKRVGGKVVNYQAIKRLKIQSV